jgi:chromosome segregation ATPase
VAVFLQQAQLWAGPIVMSILAFFLIRFVNRHDTFKSDIYKKIDDHKEDLSSSVTKISHTALEIKKDGIAIREANAKFQSDVSQQLVRVVEKVAEVETHVVKVEAILDRTQDKAGELEKKIDKSLEQVTQVNEKIQFHDRAVETLAKFAKDTKEKLTSHESDIVTVKRHIKDDLVHISHKKKGT